MESANWTYRMCKAAVKSSSPTYEYSTFYRLDALPHANHIFCIHYDSSAPDAKIIIRSSADADNGLDAFVGQSRSTNILGPFQVK